MFTVCRQDYSGWNFDDFDNREIIIFITAGTVVDTCGYPVTEGDCGYIDEWRLRALGCFGTLEEAREKIFDLYGRENLRQVESETDDYDDYLEKYFLGAYPKLTRTETQQFIYESMIEDINSKTTDSEMAALLKKYERAANRELNSSLSDAAFSILEKYRREIS